jgi:hypothetical protein
MFLPGLQQSSQSIFYSSQYNPHIILGSPVIVIADENEYQNDLILNPETKA